MLTEPGGFATLKGALIDDCTLARKVTDLRARTAFTQLRYSVTLLLLCTALMALCFRVPLAGLLAGGGPGTGSKWPTQPWSSPACPP